MTDRHEAAKLANLTRRAGFTDVTILWHGIMGYYVEGYRNGARFPIWTRGDIARIASAVR